jgi:hypothetical protein
MWRRVLYTVVSANAAGQGHGEHTRATQRPNDMCGALEVRTQLGSEQPARGAGRGVFIALSCACIAACTGGASSGATSCASNDSKGARSAGSDIGCGAGLASCRIAGAEDACWMLGKPGNGSSSRLPGDHEWIENADVMGDSCRCEGAAATRRMMRLLLRPKAEMLSDTPMRSLSVAQLLLRPYASMLISPIM